jgi:hypothetical protein
MTGRTGSYIALCLEAMVVRASREIAACARTAAVDVVRPTFGMEAAEAGRVKGLPL